jgi:hypothetical protein
MAYTGSDFRLLDCKHKRLRQALEFRPAGARVALTTPARTPVVTQATELDLELERTTPVGFLAGAASSLALALIWFMLVCMTDMNFVC